MLAPARLSLLHLEDDPLDTELAEETLRAEGLAARIERVSTMATFEAALRTSAFDLILSDYSVPGVDALHALRVTRTLRPDLPFVFLSGTIPEDLAIEALRLGATDYVLKQRMNRLAPALRRALQEAYAQRQRRRAEEELGLFRFVSENANDGHLLFDAQGRIRYANKLICERLGYAADELMRLGITDLDPTLQPERLSALIAQLSRGRMPPFEGINRHKDGTRFPVEITCAAVQFQGELLIFAVSRDITERKRHEAELARSHESLERQVEERTARLQQALQQLEQFSYTITHDMRAPLRAIKGFAAVLTEDVADQLPPEHRDHLLRIAAAAERMDNLILDTLGFSRIAAENFVLKPLDIAALLQEVIAAHPALQPPHAEIRIEGPLPLVLGAEAGITQCCANLLNNAVKFVAPGRVPHVRVHAERRGETVRLWFVDNGIGIAREHHEQIFTMFERLNNRYEGTGIGLALVRKAAERMCGRVGVESAPGTGSRFWLELHAGDGHPADFRIAASELCGGEAKHGDVTDAASDARAHVVGEVPSALRSVK